MRISANFSDPLLAVLESKFPIYQIYVHILFLEYEDILQSFNISNSSAGGTQTNTTRSNPTPNVSAQVPTGLAGLGLPNLEGMLGATPDTTGLNQLMQNPAISQMMQSVLSNPQYMNQVLI